MLLTVGVIGRSEWTYDTMKRLHEKGHKIAFIVTSKETLEYKYSSSDFKKFAYKNDIPFLHDPRIDEEKIKRLCPSLADLVISINYNGIIPSNVIKLFPFGVLNAHGGDLPKYRGNACQAWAIINGEKKIGLCIHKMIGNELDSGPIISRSYYNLNEDTRIAEVFEWMTKEIPSLMEEAVNALMRDPEYVIEHQSTDPSKSLRCYPRNPSDGLIDWNLGSDKIVKIINASSEPFDGAFTYLKNKKIKIWRASQYNDDEIWCGIPGQVSLINKEFNEVVVLTGKGKISITDIEVDGKRGKPTSFIFSLRDRFVSKI